MSNSNAYLNPKIRMSKTFNDNLEVYEMNSLILILIM